MRQFAMAVAAVLVFAVISPAFAQPFADTPTNHWAYDAIAELAAKGLIEGYPDGTFKGDRAMTRYEMAMVVARLLARIESIQIPAPAPPQKPEVTKKDIDNILRLVNEFRAELAAKNVRLTAVEEELNAIKAKLDNVRITGGVRFRYDLNQLEAGAALAGNGNPRTGSASTPRGNRPRFEWKLGFDGSVAPEIHFIAALESANGYQFFNSGNYGFNTCNNSGGAGSVNCLSQGAFASIDSAFLDWKPGFLGGTTEIWLGRFGDDSPCGGGCYPVQFGPFGLLFNTGGDTWEDSTAESGVNVADGLRAVVHLSNLSDLQIQAVLIRVLGNIGSLSFPSGEDVWGVDASVKIFQGFRLGAYYVANTIANAGSSSFTSPAPLGILFHLYGPGGGSLNPVTARCPVGPGGIQCPAGGNGWGAYVQWDVIPGIHLDVEAAQWSDTVTAGAPSDSGANATATWNLNQLLGILPGHNLIVTTGYAFYGANFYPPYGAAELDSFGWDVIYPGNAQGFTATANFTIGGGVSVYADWLTGNNVTNGQSLQEWEAGVVYSFAPNAKITLKYRDLQIAGVDQQNVYRAQVDYSF